LLIVEDQRKVRQGLHAVLEPEGYDVAVAASSIASAGKVGLWSKADARPSFDRFRVRDLGN
jgi:CheY-like chemotaxis protein